MQVATAFHSKPLVINKTHLAAIERGEERKLVRLNRRGRTERRRRLERGRRNRREVLQLVRQIERRRRRRTGAKLQTFL